jgi:hypothetical protein
MDYKKHLEEYVLRNENLKEFSKTSDSWPLLKDEIIVYRGHNHSENIRNSSFYSTSKDIDLVYNNFTGESCCIFKIHVMPGIKFIDVNKIMGSHHRYAEDKEIILDGTGDFYKDKQREIKGFTEIKPYKGKKVFETYYFLKKKKVSRNNLIARLNEAEFEFYNKEQNYLNAFKTVLKNDEEFNNNSNTSTKKGGKLAKAIRMRKKTMKK